MTSTAPKPRAYYVYDHHCRECGVHIQTRRPPGDKACDAQHCKTCLLKIKERRREAKYPGLKVARTSRWNKANRERYYANNSAYYYRHHEKNKARIRAYHEANPWGGKRYSWEKDLAREIEQLAMI